MKRYADGFAPSLPVTARRTPTVAIAHDQLTSRGVAERVVLAMLRAFPKAAVYTTFYDPEATFPEFRDADVRVSRYNRSAFLRRHAQAAAPVLPVAARSVRIDADVVLCSSSGVAHGVRTSGRKLVYWHAPAGWLYQRDGAPGAAPVAPQRLAVRGLRPLLRVWDRRCAAHADRYLATCRAVSERVRGTYGVTADVVAPPYAVSPSSAREPVAALADWADSGFHLVVSPLRREANIEAVIDAFRGLTQRLVVVGDGPLAGRLRAESPVNVRLVGELDDAGLAWVHERAHALLAPSAEDLGLAALEAASFGTPTLALHGGHRDTVRDGRTGLFFQAPTPEQIRDAVCRAGARSWDPQLIQAHAQQFSEARFRARLRAAVADVALR